MMNKFVFLVPLMFIQHTVANAADAPSRSSNLHVQFSSLEEEVRTLNGSIEELQNKIEQVTKNFEKFQKDTELRFDEIAKKLEETQIASKGNDSKPENNDSESVDGEEKNPKKVIDAAEGLVSQKKYESARKILQDFVGENPKNIYVGMAYYWIGESFYRQKNYREASIAFVSGYKENKKGALTPDTLYKLAKSLLALGKKKEASITLNKLLKDYPNAQQKLLSQASAELNKQNKTKKK